MLSQTKPRRSLIAALALVIAATQSAQASRKLHVIIAADKTDSSIGQYCRSDAEHLSTLFHTNVRPSEINFIDVPASQLSSDGLRSVIRSAGVRAEDAVLFYYSGHGQYARDGKHYFVVGGRQIGRAVVKSELQSRGAGLTVLISDACFNFNDVPPPTGGSARQVMGGITAPLFRKLFFETNGFIDLNSCRKDETAATHPDASLGSVFTKALVDKMGLKRSMSNVTWQSLMDEVAQETARQFQLQHPDGVTLETSDNFLNQRSQTVARIAFNTFANDSGPTIEEVPQAPGPVPGTNSPIETANLEIAIDPYSGRTNQTLVTYKYYPLTGRTTTQRGRGEFKGIASVIKASDDTEYWRWPQVRNPDIVHGDPTYVRKLSRKPDGPTPDGTPKPEPSPGSRQIANARFGISVANHTGQGVVIRKVTPGGPATKCLGSGGKIWRLEVGDAVVRINGRQVKSVNQFARAVRTSSRTMGVQVLSHDGTSHQMTVTLAGASTPIDPGPVPGKGPRFGVTVSTLLGKGVVITSVVPGSPATKCSYKGSIYRLETGDLVTKINGQRITSEASFARAVRASGRVMTFRVKDLTKNKSYDFKTTLNH